MSDIRISEITINPFITHKANTLRFSIPIKNEPMKGCYIKHVQPFFAIFYYKKNRFRSLVFALRWSTIMLDKIRSKSKKKFEEGKLNTSKEG